MSKDLTENWPLQDSKQIIERVTAIEEAAEDFSEFEVEFLTEVLRMARKFGDTLRLTPKQLATLKELEDRWLLPRKIAAKLRKPKSIPKEKA